MASPQHIENGVQVVDELFAYDTHGAPVTGILNGEWTKELYNPAGAEVSGAVTVTVTELGASGIYRVTWTPNAIGSWVLRLTNATNSLAQGNEYECFAVAAVGELVDGSITAAKVATDAIDADALAADAVAEIQSGLATPGDAMDLVAGAVDAAAVATDAIDADALAADAVAEIQSGLATSAAVASIAADMARLLGLEHENSFLDNTAHDAFAQLLSARLRCFDSKANADLATDGGNEIGGLIATYQITAVYEGPGRLRDYRVTLEP